MSTDLSARLSSCTAKVNSFKGSRSVLNRSIDDLTDKIIEIDTRLSDLSVEQGVLDKSMGILKQFVSIVSNHGLAQYIELINKGLRSIFYDRVYEFKVEIEDRGKNKRVFMFFREQLEGTWTDWMNVDNGGAGMLQMVIDLITRVYLINALGRRKFLLFDESLSQASDEYIQNVIDFLETISKEMGFDIVFISHDGRYTEQAHRIYRMVRGNAVLQEKGQ